MPFVVLAEGALGLELVHSSCPKISKITVKALLGAKLASFSESDFVLIDFYMDDIDPR